LGKYGGMAVDHTHAGGGMVAAEAGASCDPDALKANKLMPRQGFHAAVILCYASTM